MYYARNGQWYPYKEDAQDYYMRHWYGFIMLLFISMFKLAWNNIKSFIHIFSAWIGNEKIEGVTKIELIQLILSWVVTLFFIIGILVTSGQSFTISDFIHNDYSQLIEPVLVIKFGICNAISYWLMKLYMMFTHPAK
ncbi:hypothetical protein [Companilactobacillus ginsenosidimutans]|uniref:Uncharacterized protein n=1 Tax=Companilactobacillus ginsenosidimutans TaxID=1007676 RepID=A0A0H4QGT3_9LACO|nr:hypothetical protein [Companilactobacillus ginsenosidimutans]AKP67619.1 hypothetical protein ABM34_08800 [Companilactobacillus ginsenosidimutans]